MQQQFELCKVIHREFMSDMKYQAFFAPVAWKKAGLLDYPTIIKQPMDLGTIEKKLSKDAYKTPSEFIFDMRLIYRNCMKYNLEGSEMFEIGRSFMIVFEKRISSTDLFNYDFIIIPKKSDDRKSQFLQLLKESRPEIASVVYSQLQLLQANCIESNTPQDVVIHVNELEDDVFDYLLEFMISMRE